MALTYIEYLKDNDGKNDLENGNYHHENAATKLGGEQKCKHMVEILNVQS